MAVIRGVGARIFVVPSGESPHNFGVQLFADLPSGERVTTDEVTTFGAGALPDTVEDLETVLLASLRHPNLTAEQRDAFWGPLVTALREGGVDTDAETIMRLPFRSEPNDEVRALFA
jgi:hypothetical protein